MTIVVVDPNTKNSSELIKFLQEICPDSNVLAFRDPLLALKYGGNNPVDIIFAEAEMRRANGFMLFDTLRKFRSDMRTVITADDDSYREKAVAMGVSAYLQRPITKEDVCKAASVGERCEICE